MKKRICLTAAILAVLLLAGCSASAALPPRREGLFSMKVSLEERHSLASAAEGSDLIVLARVGDWIGEDADKTNTYFKAKVLETFKGECGEEIVLIQDGCSLTTVQGYPLFTAGNELLLFLKTGTASEYENAYWMIGSFTAFFDAAQDKSGALYYLDRYGILGQSVTECENLILAPDDGTLKELYAALEKTDPLAAERRYHYVFSAEELDPVLEEIISAE